MKSSFNSEEKWPVDKYEQERQSILKIRGGVLKAVNRRDLLCFE